MDPLQPQAQKIICETRPTSQINGKAEYPWREGNALYLVGSEGCAVLWAAKFPFSIMATLGPMLLFRLRTMWKTVDGKFYPTRLIAQTLPLLTTICFGRCRTPLLEYGSHQNRVSKIGFIHFWPPSRRNSFEMEPTNWQKVGKKS